MKRFSKRGSITVFVLVFATTLIGMITIYINAAKNLLVRSGAYALGDLWATSILAEYDSELYDKYGLLGYYGNEGIVGRKLQSYVDYTFGDKDYANCSVSQVMINSYTLASTKNLIDQIRVLGTLDLLATRGSKSLDGFVRYNDGSGGQGVGRDIVNQSTLNSLPSKGRTSDGLLDRAGELLKAFSSVKDIVREGTDSFLINEYVKGHFRNIYQPMPGNDHYLFGEEEYIIGGMPSDEKNRKTVRNRIVAMREVMNLLYLETNEEAHSAALTAGEVVTIGLAGEEAAQVILSAWALAESVNDYELLIRGKPVPVMKDKSSWAVDIESVVENKSSGCIDTGNSKGDRYEDYLCYLMYLLDDNTKLLRIMDLIQINMRYNYRDDFLLSEHYTGVTYKLNANGETYEFHDEY